VLITYYILFTAIFVSSSTSPLTQGELKDRTNIAVKRIEYEVITTKQIDQFQAEIDVLQKIRHQKLIYILTRIFHSRRLESFGL
jgi:hypothetical protein